MKRILFCIIMLCGMMSISAQKQVNITMKNGSKLTAELVKMNLPESITIKIAGVETNIAMSEIDIMEESKSGLYTTAGQVEELSKDEKFRVTDTAEYPDSFVIDMNGSKITMVLVRGGVMNMGYDGRNSINYTSEPIHKVYLTSYYISKELITKEAYANIADKEYKYKEKNKHEPIDRDYQEIQKFVKNISEAQGKTFRLLTEAEWEYMWFYNMNTPVIIKDMQNWRTVLLEDNFYKFTNLTQKDPILYDGKKSHVVRDEFVKDNHNYWASRSFSTHGKFRIAIKAKDWLGK